MKRVETKVIDAGEKEGAYVNNSNKPSIAIRVAMFDFGTINPINLIKQTKPSNNHNTSGWISKSEIAGHSVTKVGSKVPSKGTLDLALDNLQILFAGAWDALAGIAAVEPL